MTAPAMDTIFIGVEVHIVQGSYNPVCVHTSIKDDRDISEETQSYESDFASLLTSFVLMINN